MVVMDLPNIIVEDPRPDPQYPPPSQLLKFGVTIEGFDGNESAQNVSEWDGVIECVSLCVGVL